MGGGDAGDAKHGGRAGGRWRRLKREPSEADGDHASAVREAEAYEASAFLHAR